jgi:hypothetical protein
MPQRSPLLIWLLAAATICADVVALAATLETPSNVDLQICLFALLLGQLSVVCIWAVMRAAPNLWTRLLPPVAVLAVPAATATVVDENLLAFVGFCGLHAAFVMAALWILRRTPYWRRRTGNYTNLQFSVLSLLLLSTIVAVLIVVTRQAELFKSGDRDEASYVAAFLIGTVVLSVLSVVVMSGAAHWLLKSAAVLGIALAVGGLFYFFDGVDSAIFMSAHLLTQAVVLIFWLGLAPVLPANTTDAADTSTTAERPPTVT